MAAAVTFVKEGREWKVVDEAWNVSGPSAGGAPAAASRNAPEVLRPPGEEFAKLRGQWKGREVGGSNESTFSFGDGYTVVVSDGQQQYEGLAALHFELGLAQDGSIHVPPGSGVLDIDVQGGSPEYAGKTSLGAYYLTSPTELKLCGSRPGVNVRTQSYDSSSAEVRCFTLTKIAE